MILPKCKNTNYYVVTFDIKTEQTNLVEVRDKLNVIFCSKVFHNINSAVNGVPN
jgi:hypothetical protein